MNKIRLLLSVEKKTFTKIGLVMKLTTIFLFLASLQISASVYSQNTKININVKNTTLLDIFNEIERQSEFRIFYKTDQLNLDQRYDFEADGMTVSEVLNNILSDSKSTYKLIDRIIVITPVKDMQQQKISGKVTDIITGEPIIGANIVIDGTTIGTVTDIDGKFSLDVTQANAVLVVSFLGFNTERITLNGQTLLDIKLVQDITKLDEVVVIGYGTQKQASVTGSVSKVSGKDLAATTVTNMSQALQGRVAGVMVTNNGSPGSAPIVRIRGVGSINLSSSPLYVIDGIPTGSINSIDSKDIESIDVLKDASSAAIYGSRGSNGVIIVTTKKGSSDGKYSVNFESSVGTQKVWKTLDLMKSADYIKFGKVLLANANPVIPEPYRFSHMDEPTYPGSSKTFAETDTDWQNEIFRTAPIQKYSISLSGGNQKSKFFSSLGYLNQQGVMLGTGYKRLNFRLNSNHEVSKRINFGQTFSVSNDNNDMEVEPGGRTIIQTLTRMIPYIPVYDPNNLGGFSGASTKDGSDPANPVRVIKMRINNYIAFNLMGTAFLEVKATNWLKYKLSIGLDHLTGKNRDWRGAFNEGGYQSSLTANLTDRVDYSDSWVYTNQLTFDKTIGNHYINAVAVAEQQFSDYTKLSGQGTLPNNSIVQLEGITNPSAGGGLDQSRLFSYLGRAQYSYANKYLLSASIRTDGSGKFAPGHKWGVFRSFSGGWRISEESFMKNQSVVSDLKLKASYGETGANAVSSYPWQVSAQSDATVYILNGTRVTGSMINNLGNTDLQWETTKMANFGIDASFLNHTLLFSAEYYNRKTDNLIINADLAPSLGYKDKVFQNIGEMVNKGFEFQLGYSKKINDFSIDASGNIAFNVNEVLKLAGTAAKPEPIFAGSDNTIGGFPITRTMVGSPIQEFYGFQTDGIFQNQAEIDALNWIDDKGNTQKYQKKAEPGDIKFKDISGPDGKPDGKIDDYDRASLGSYLPKFTYGFNLNVAYKGFDLSLFIQGTYGNKIYNATKVHLQGMTRLFNGSPEVLNAWTPTNTNTSIPRAVSGDPNENVRTSNRFVEDGSYLRIKNLSIGYTVPEKFLGNVSKGTIKSVRFYVSSQNLLTITKYSGYDPEIGLRNNYGPLAQGIDYGQYPQPRTFLGGIQVRF